MHKIQGGMFFRVRRAAAFFAALCALFPWQASADEIVMENGSRLKGTVESLTVDQLVLTSDYAEPIKLKTGKIKSIATDSAVAVRMKNGEILNGGLHTDGDGVMYVEQADGKGRAVIDLKQIAAINPPSVDQWNGSITVAGNYQTGNTDRTALKLGANAVRRNDRHRFHINFLYDIAAESGTLSSRSIYGTLKYDYFFSRTLYGYQGLELLNDTFKDLDLRAVVGSGLGYQVWDDPKKALAVEAGVSYSLEDHKTGNDKYWVTARLAADYRYRFTDGILFTNNLVLYPSLENFSDHNLRNEAAITTALGWGWSLKLANILEYDSRPEAGIKDTDSDFILGLAYAF